VALAPIGLPRFNQTAVDGRVLVFTAVVAILTGLLSGLAPAWRSVTAGGEDSLVVDLRGSVAGRSRARTLLVVLDFALALVLLAGAGLMLRTVAAIAHADPGFRTAGVLTLQFSLAGNTSRSDASIMAFERAVLEKLRAIPGVESVAVGGGVPFGGVHDCWGFHARGRMAPNTADDPCVERYSIGGDYLRVLGIPVIAGRRFTDADNDTSARVILISQATAKRVWGSADPIGAQVRIGSLSAWRTVIGVVGDVHHGDLTVPPTPAMYTPETQITSGYLTALIGAPAAQLAALAPAARAAIHELNPTVPVYGVEPLSALVSGSAADRVFVMRLLVAFAGVALVLAAVGLYGVVSYAVCQRSREVGVRVALGARPADVIRLVLGGGFPIVAVGVAAGLTISILATRLLGSLVFGVSPTDGGTLLGAAALLVAVALLAHAVPLRRALRIDPASALGAE
jgi:putative ABC transport system permease protein